MSTTNNQDLLDTLTPEERAAISDSEYSPEELAAMKGIAGDDDGDGDDEDTAGNDDGETAGASAPIDESAQSPAPGSETEPPQQQARAATYRAELPADYDAQAQAVKDEMSALTKQFKEGEVDLEDFESRQAELLAKRDELRDAKIKAEISSEMSAQTAEQQWNDTIQSFVSAVSKEIDYTKDAEKQADLDLFVRRLASDQRNNDKPGIWFLEEAHKRVKALHLAGEQKREDLPLGKPAARKAPVDAIPKTLAQVPGSDGPGDVGDEFADLDGLEGLELEDALRKMTPAQREKYAMAGV